MNNDDAFRIEDVACWLEDDSSVMLKAVTSYGDPVELSLDEVRQLIDALSRYVIVLEKELQTSPRNPAAEK